MTEKLDIIGICNELGLSESTVMDYIFSKGLPAKRSKSGEWECSKEDLQRWRFPDVAPPTFERLPAENEPEEPRKPGRKPKK